MKYDIAAALQALTPGAEWVLRGSEFSGLEWLDTNQTQPTESAVTTKIAELDAAEGNKGSPIKKCRRLRFTRSSEVSLAAHPETWSPRSILC